MIMVKQQLGNRLVLDGIITEDQLTYALECQADIASEGQKSKLGTILVQLGYCTDDDIANAVSQNSGLSLISLNNTPVDMDAASLISSAIAQKYQLLPISFDGKKLRVAMQNPNDLMAIDDLHIITGREIIPVIAPDIELKAVIEQFANISNSVESITEDDDEDISFISDDNNPDKPAVLLTGQILNNAIRAGASDIHIEPQERSMRVRYRIDGVLHEVMQQPSSIHASVTSRIKVMGSMDIAERRIPQDGRATVKIDNKTIDIRIASLPSAYGETLTLRLLNRSSKVITVSELGFPDQQMTRFMNTLNIPYGFLLVTGPTGSGKSTTLYAALSELNTIDRNIITLEDPIERRVAGLNQIQMNTRAGMTFASGLRSILRSDPDVIMIGEIRDQETAKIAVESALTGHFVLSTLHTNDAASAVTRLGEMGVEPFLTAASLVGVIAQRLVRVLCPRCKEAYTLTKKIISETIPDFPLDPDEEEVVIYRPVGCLACNNTGFKGRHGVYEFLMMSDEIKKLILESASLKEIHDVAIKQGMVSLRSDGLLKVKQGITSIEELLRVIV
ncbi:MAG: ATPase, T2SS/T4P/T4SS family [Oscillospiraceae bacterium]